MLPCQIVIVDASEDWQTSRDAIAEMLAAHPSIRLDYLHSPVRSSSTQRNAGIEACIGDVLFMIDDDSFLYKDCAEEVLAVYVADPDGKVAAVQPQLADTAPPIRDEFDGQELQRKKSGNRGALKDVVLGSQLGRWFHRRVLMQSIEETFLRYDGPRQYPHSPKLTEMGLTSLSFMPGCAMTVRRPIAKAEPFDTALRYYAAYEDVDVSYRYARHGHVLFAPKARLHHYEVAGGRMHRKAIIAFQLLNMVVYLKRNAARPDDWIAPYRMLVRRRLLGEFLKDLLSRRFSFPQVRGVLFARRNWRQIWNSPTEQLDQTYPEFQRRILETL